MRFDRIDNFWFVLIHECTHVLYRHGQEAAIIDEDIAPCDNSIDGEEKVANAEAAEFCVPSEKMRSFYLRKNPFFSHVDVQAFAKRNQIHPGLVVGQLHKMTGQYNLLRQYLVNVRKFLISTAMTDGWGNAVAVG